MVRILTDFVSLVDTVSLDIATKHNALLGQGIELWYVCGSNCFIVYSDSLAYLYIVFYLGEEVVHVVPAKLCCCVITYPTNNKFGYGLSLNILIILNANFDLSVHLSVCCVTISL